MNTMTIRMRKMTRKSEDEDDEDEDEDEGELEAVHSRLLSAIDKFAKQTRGRQG